MAGPNFFLFQTCQSYPVGLGVPTPEKSGHGIRAPRKNGDFERVCVEHENFFSEKNLQLIFFGRQIDLLLKLPLKFESPKSSGRGENLIERDTRETPGIGFLDLTVN